MDAFVLVYSLTKDENCVRPPFDGQSLMDKDCVAIAEQRQGRQVFAQSNRGRIINFFMTVFKNLIFALNYFKIAL